jgi:hypothetical protein
MSLNHLKAAPFRTKGRGYFVGHALFYYARALRQ